jgi:S-adenosylmethionine:tRNA ribosyltransferase-isomerase
MKVSLFDYYLPGGRIAQEPRPRGASRLLVLDRGSGAIAHRRFADFPDLLAAGDLVVRNDVRVLPARLYGHDAEGRLVEIFLLKPLEGLRRWEALAKPGRRARPGRLIRFDEGVVAEVEDARGGRRIVLFDKDLEEPLLARIGRTPLPPYIRREPGAPDRQEDREAYQTVFARQPLAVAAPTAGLHFTDEHLSALSARGVAVVDLTLAVGAGTFKPVTAEDTGEHTLDAENVWIPAVTSAAVARARAEARRVVAVGTTVTRSLEAAVRREDFGRADLAFSADLFITPGFEFHAVDALLTNFHLPRSTLLMLICAFAGRERVLAAYEEAVRQGYLFYSFGDAMFIA